jgi:hypothetical protein
MAIRSKLSLGAEWKQTVSCISLVGPLRRRRASPPLPLNRGRGGQTTHRSPEFPHTVVSMVKLPSVAWYSTLLD